MSDFRQRVILLTVIALAAFLFFTDISWGLPSNKIDPFLFGGRPVWTGQQILDLAGPWDDSGDRGADIAMHPLTNRDKPILVNATDAQRAQIIRRFRLYSSQPDEMITFRSLASMKPSAGDFDPRFYQYGGLWVYPVGILLKLAALLGFITLKSNIAFYLEHPDQFARFYIIARCYSAAWGILGLAVVYALAKEWTQKFFPAILAAILYCQMPVVVNMAHEAKPHLAGAVLTLAAIFMSLRYTRTGKTRDWILTGVACGAAFGMVLTGIVSFAILPLMTLLRPIPWKARIKIASLSTLIGASVFIATNPYLPINLLFHHNVLQSNVGNYGNFYRPALSLAGFANALKLLAEGMSLPLAVVALVATAFLLRLRKFAPGILLAIPAALISIQYLLLAHDQIAEYGRFALTLDVILAIAAASAISSLTPGRYALAAILCVTTGLAGLRYLANFSVSDTRLSTRWVTAENLEILKQKARGLAIWAEPAPYCLPPVDLFDWKIILLPRGSTLDQFNLGANVIAIRPLDEPHNDPEFPNWAAAPISWSNKPFEIITH